ncbi:molybdopterin-binding protein [Humibacter sp. RRB41]|jgi:molybdopterin-binding protein|uniref:TOBE domain-containing protein n=1 Tax=Humibacter sp. RRB41 TaxID=2919946 RepID=UPI001FA9A7EF|nr:TOBE domain-containing protein [Humibacter sp. RRB41]
MTYYRISEAAELLAVSDDTVRRWIRDGLVVGGTDDAGRQVIDGPELARYATEIARAPADTTEVLRSARNHFAGIVTKVVSDPVMSQVELQCGTARVVSLMSTEAVRDLRLEVGSRAVAVVKATMVVVEAAKEENG